MKPIRIFCLFLVAAVFAAAASAQTEPALDQSTKNTVKTVVSIGRVQGDPAADGTLVLTIIPRITKLDSEGTVISSEFAPASEWFTITLNTADLMRNNAAIQTTFDAKRAAAVQASAEQVIPSK